MSAAGKKTHVILQVKVEGQADRLIVFDTQDLTIGRSNENDLAIDHVEISRRHARFIRGDGYCMVEDMGTSNGTTVNGETASRQQLSMGDVVRLAEVEIVYRETARNPAELGARAEYASQLKSVGLPQIPAGGGEATILGLVDTLSPSGGGDDDDFEVKPAGDFDYDLHDMERAPAPATARNLDQELEGLGSDLDDLDFEDAPAAPAPPHAGAARGALDTQVWDLDDEGKGTLSLTLEIAGLEPELRRALVGLLGKEITLPSLRIRVKGDDLG